MAGLRDVGIRQYEALVAVADEGTFAKAAERLGFTQSAISQQIAGLERSVRLAVFDRPKGPRPVELTRAGEAILVFARALLADVADMDAELDRRRRGVSGHLVVGSFQSVSSEILPTIIGRMRSEAPDVDLQVVETDDLRELVGGVLDDRFDLAFTVDVEPDPRLLSDVLGYDPFVVIAPAGESNGSTATADELNERPLVGQPDDDSSQVMIDRRLVDVGVRPEYAFRFQDNGAVQSMVRNGLGWSVMPSLAIVKGDPGIDVLDFDPPIAPRRIQLIRRSGRTLPVAVERFVRIAGEVAGPLLDDAPGAGGLLHADPPAAPLDVGSETGDGSDDAPASNALGGVDVTGVEERRREGHHR